MFGSLKSKFVRWQDAGLVSEEQASAILAFEKTRKSGKMVRDLTNIGIFAILLGLASIVASHWAGIPDAVKLAGHFLLSGALAALMLKIDRDKHPVGKDACLLLLFGSFLTFIALIGQVYELHGDLHVTLAFWLAICTPFVWFFGRTYSVIVPWLLVTLLTLYMNMLEYLDGDNAVQVVASTVLTFYLPTILILISRLFWLVRNRPGFTQSFYRLGLILPVLFANICIFLFYEFLPAYPVHYVLQVALMAAGLLFIFFAFRPQHARDESARDLWYYLLVSHIVIMLPFALPGLDSGVLAAVVFIGYWLFMAWLGARMHSGALMDWSIRLVILRLFIVYLEVFGSMLHTGVGLLASGILLLMIVRYQSRLVAFGRKVLNYEI